MGSTALNFDSWACWIKTVLVPNCRVMVYTHEVAACKQNEVSQMTTTNAWCVKSSGRLNSKITSSQPSNIDCFCGF